MEKIKIGLPKGKVHGKAKRLIENFFDAELIKDKLYICTEKYDFFLLKHRDIARLVAEGTLDFGITSEEWLRELRVENEVNIIKKLDWCDTKISLITHESKDGINKNCITEFYNIAIDYLKSKPDMDVKVDKISGSSEALIPAIYDCCIDCVETGTTLEKNNLIVKDVIFESSMVFIGNKFKAESLINEILLLI